MVEILRVIGLSRATMVENLLRHSGPILSSETHMDPYLT